MASGSRVSILDYFDIVFEGENGKIESKCKACGTRIQAKRTVTSNFVTHLKVGSARGLRGAPSSSCLVAASKFDRNDPRQALISEAIAKMMIRDLQAVETVENEGFRELLQLLEPRYAPESRLYVQRQLLPGYAYQVQLATKQALTAAESCSVTLDLWQSGAAGRGTGYLGVTCHFITGDWQARTALLACLPLASRRIVQRTLVEFDAISRTHSITGKVFRVVAGSTSSERRAAFRLPGFCLRGGEGDEEEEENGSRDEERRAVESSEAGGELALDISLGFSLGSCPIDCFAHSLGLCVREGLRSSPQLSVTLAKAACFYNYVTATVPPEKLGRVFGSTGTADGLPASREQSWNSQLKTVRRMLESADFLEDVVGRRDLELSCLEKALLTELVELLEPFEEAADMVQGDKHVSISLALPCVLGLRKHLSETHARQCTGILVGLAHSLDRRLASILEDPLYVTATALDPQFKLSWSSDAECHKQMLLKEVAKHIRESSLQESSKEPPNLQPSERRKLFSFIKQRPASRAKSIEQELAAYLHEEPTDEDPMHYWKRKATDFPRLSQVAKKVFTVPASTTPVGRIFRTVGRNLKPERCRPLYSFYQFSLHFNI
uniref:Si:dkey-109j17.5 n=1 Tax=Scleropages formosus TaxID=113540 RepID=A0A8C9T8Y7_SCLFO